MSTKHPDSATKPDATLRPVLTRIEELESAIDERDEIIRLLNEALSQALDELTEVRRAA